MISIDFETRSASDIRLGLERYSKDAEAEVLTLSYRLPSGNIQRWNPTLPPPNDLIGQVRDGALVRGWNVMFEWNIWNNVCVPKYGWPPLKLEQCVDTMAQAAAQNLPQALGRCAEALKLPTDKQKSTRGKYLIQRLCVPHPPTKARPGKWVEDADLFAELCDYCDQDVIVEETIAGILRPLLPFEQEIWLLTQRINRRGVPVAIDEVRAIVKVVEAEKERLNRELREITQRVVMKASDRAGVLRWVNERQADVTPDLAGDTLDAVLKRQDLKPEVRRVLEIRQQVCQTSTAKFPKLLSIAADDGTLKNLLVYHGAGPGRWVSRGGWNAQNLARPLLKKMDIATAHTMLATGDHAHCLMLWGDELMAAAVSCLRGVIKAPPGYDIVDADYSSVENRVGVWLAGQDDKVEMFRNGLDEYKVFAGESLFNVAYEDVTDEMRQMSKSAVLGCLFGQGPKGLVEYSKGFGLVLALERAEEIVKAYRADYSRVRALWHACNSAAIAAIKKPGHWQAAGERLKLQCHDNFLWMKLPSGRMISWANPTVESRDVPWEEYTTKYKPDRTPYIVKETAQRPVVTVESVSTFTKQWTRDKLIGASIFQSAVQGTARDVLAQGLVQTEAAGYQAVLLVHDEIMALVREGEGCHQEFGRLMCEPADWYADLPLSFDAWRAKRFQK